MGLSVIDQAGIAAKGVGAANMHTGAVLQVVNATYTAQTSTSSSTFVDTGLTASITPSSINSKILVTVFIGGVLKQSGDAYGSFRLVRNSTQILTFENGVGYTASSAYNGVGSVGTTYLDSPSTTSATTYKVQGNSVANTAYIFWSNNNCASTITLMEIAG